LLFVPLVGYAFYSRANYSTEDFMFSLVLVAFLLQTDDRWQTDDNS